MKRFAGLLLLMGCSSSSSQRDRIEMSFRFEGALAGTRDIALLEDATAGPRIACVLHKSELVVSAVQNHGERHGTGVYLRVSPFHGPATYTFTDADRAWAFDDGHIQLCTRADDRACFQGSGGCSLTLDQWELGPAGESAPAGVQVGVAHGRFDCPSLSNVNTAATIGVRDGFFRCRAEDWTNAGG